MRLEERRGYFATDSRSLGMREIPQMFPHPAPLQTNAHEHGGSLLLLSPPQVGLVDLLYSKSLRVGAAARASIGIGSIVNLQSNDAAKLWNLPQYL